eukprot:scaffold1316_cov130-Isochrysis_galbana.AAC.5
MGNVLPTSWAPPPPTPAGPPTIKVTFTSDASVNPKNSTLAYDQIGWGNLTTGNDATPLSSSYPFQKLDDDLPLIIWAPPPHPPAGPTKSGPKPDPVNLKRPTLAYDQIGRWTFTTGVCITPLPTKIHSLLSPKSDFLPTAPRIPHPIFLAVYSNAAQAGLEPVNPMCISAPPTGPLHYAVTEQYAKDYLMLYPQGIDVPSEKESDPPIHFEVTSRQASKPNPAKRRVAANVLARIAITVQHFELRDLAQFITPADLGAGWAALGFDPINPA